MGAGPGGSGDRVLVVDDATEIRRLVVRALERDGYVVLEAADGVEALDRLRQNRPDLVVLDVGLPKLDGLEVLREMRRTNEVPVILLTGRSEENDRVIGLELGADDYIVKPFSARELVARVRAVLRRRPGAGGGTYLEFDDLVIDTATREVVVHGTAVQLRQKEFDLLAFLATSPKQVFTREQLLQQVWSSSAEWQDPRTVTEHVRRLRLHLEPDPENPRWLKTVRGIGYRFEP